METRTKGRIYITVNAQDEINSITSYESNGKRSRSINLLHSHADIKGSHTHIGYEHAERGTRRLNKKERELVDYVQKIWHNRKGK